MLDQENEDEYELRICGYHDIDGLTWDDIAQIINAETDRNYTESRYRRMYKAYLRGLEEGQIGSCVNPQVEEMIVAKLNVEKEKVKLSDERVQIRAYVRELAREETLKEIAQMAAERVSQNKFLPSIISNKEYNGENEAILELSDIHYGIECSNYWNTYNPDIARQRMNKLLEEVIARCKQNNVSTIRVANLGDAIAGRIHLGLRLESRFDVITQTIEISEILAEFLNTLSQTMEVHYYDCLDNHSRLEPNKKDAMDLESLARIIPWYLKTRLQNNITIHENKYGPDIITFKCKNYNILGVHGDKDKPTTVVDNLSMMTHEHYDMILTSHLHHFSANEKNETLVVSNGSLMGTDTYASNLRLSSNPSQNLIIVSDNNVMDCLYRICVN